MRSRDWTEDESHENGQYYCTCIECGERFIGHKRRVICKTCAGVAAAIEDLRTHHRGWRVALMHALHSAEPKTEDTDEPSYWQHEIGVFDRVCAALCPEPTK